MGKTHKLLTVALEKATKFFVFVFYDVLPELLGRWYSKLPVYSDGITESAASQENVPSNLKGFGAFADLRNHDKMIACENKQFIITGFIRFVYGLRSCFVPSA